MADGTNDGRKSKPWLSESGDGWEVDLHADDGFAPAPTAFQRRWMLGRAMREFADDLRHLGGLIARFVPGEERSEIRDAWTDSEAHRDEAELLIQDQQVMQAWERPLMKRLAQEIAGPDKDVLEIGFGMGISASFIQEVGARSYTVVEPNRDVMGAFEAWRARHPDADVRLVEGTWQEAADQLGEYDGILFDTYPLSQEEYVRNEVEGSAYAHAAEFFPLAAEKLRPGGAFTYFTCEIDTLSRGHQRALMRHFDEVSLRVQRGLSPPDGCQYWWSDSMVVVRASSPRRPA